MVQSLGQEDPLEKEMAPTPVFLPGKFYGQRSLAACRPQGFKESDMTEATEYVCVYIYIYIYIQRERERERERGERVCLFGFFFPNETLIGKSFLFGEFSILKFKVIIVR